MGLNKPPNCDVFYNVYRLVACQRYVGAMAAYREGIVESSPDPQKSTRTRSQSDSILLPAPWRAFIEYCRHLGHGQIERLVIQDGVPVLAEVTKQKIKFVK